MADNIHTRHFGLIGNPLGHSLSSKYFQAKFTEQNIDADYTLYPIPKIEDVEEIIRRLEGFNVTIPYKQSIIQYLDFVDSEAKEVGAVNCVRIMPDGHRYGYNTDVIGIRETLKGVGLRKGQKALILGTGGASKAVRYVLCKMGLRPEVVSRQKGLANYTYDELDEKLMDGFSLIVNATPVGMYPADSKPSIPYNGIKKNHILFDLIYNPQQTLFLKEGLQRGAKVISGMTMFITQAEASWQIWNK